MHDAALQLDYDVLILTFYFWRGVSRSPGEMVTKSFTIAGLWIDGENGWENIFAKRGVSSLIEHQHDTADRQPS